MHYCLCIHCGCDICTSVAMVNYGISSPLMMALFIHLAEA